MQPEENKELPPAADDVQQQLSNPSAKTITEAEQSPTTNHNPPTENMEVHHHAHHEHGKKNWKSYLWEFLMLFLAVFCGFLAEYQLEHTIEHQREKEYMESLVHDLQRDTAEINQADALGRKMLSKMDSLLQLINEDEISSSNIKKIYELSRASSRLVIARFEDRTSSQLKNAGGMRLIRNRAVVDSILLYWTGVDVCNTIQERLDRIGDARADLAVQLFHNKYYISSSNPMVDSDIKENPQLISNNPALMAEYSNRTYSRSRVLLNYLLNLKEIKMDAERLINFIEKEYHLD